MSIKKYCVNTIIISSCIIIGGVIGLVSGEIIKKYCIPIKKIENNNIKEKSKSVLDFNPHGEPNSEIAKITIKSLVGFVEGNIDFIDKITQVPLFSTYNKLTFSLGSSIGLICSFYLCI